MNVVDVNILLYAYDERAALHEPAKAWLTDELRIAEPTGLSHATVLAFVRISTAPRILLQPFAIRDACEIVDDWLRQPSVVLLEPTERHWRIFATLAVASQSPGPLVPDADLAATALEHGATLCTHDRDFTRFEGVRVRYPLVNSL